MIDLGIVRCSPLPVGWRIYLRGDSLDSCGRWYVRQKWRSWESRGRREWTVLTLSASGTLTEHSVMADSWLEAAADCPSNGRVVGVWLGRSTGRDDDLATALTPLECRARLEHPRPRTMADWPEGWVRV